MVWQKYGAIQNVCHLGMRGGKVDKKKVTKSDVGEGFAAKKSDVNHSKKMIFCEWHSFWMAPMIMFYFPVFFYECICWWRP